MKLLGSTKRRMGGAVLAARRSLRVAALKAAAEDQGETGEGVDAVAFAGLGVELDGVAEAGAAASGDADAEAAGVGVMPSLAIAIRMRLRAREGNLDALTAPDSPSAVRMGDGGQRGPWRGYGAFGVSVWRVTMDIGRSESWCVAAVMRFICRAFSLVPFQRPN